MQLLYIGQKNLTEIHNSIDLLTNVILMMHIPNSRKELSRVVTWVQIACQPENGYGNLDLILWD